jgi:glycosyltransferase involved in cell wall biosynthesis
MHIAGGSDPAHLDYYKALQDLVARLKLQDRVTFYGHVNDTSSWYHQIDIFISNSYSEGLQVALMEAMASGCNCLSHHWIGAGEILPEENLYFTDTELREKIQGYCEISEEEKQKRKAFMRAIACEKLDIEVTKVQIRNVIDEVGFASLSKRDDR